MKKKIKKLFTLLLTLGIFIGTFCFDVADIMASSGNLQITYLDGYTTGKLVYGWGSGTVCEDGKDHRVFTLNGNNRFLGVFSIQGKVVYCIQPLVETASGYYYTESTMTNLNSGLSQNLKNKLELASYFGYGYNNDYSELSRVATQFVIWEYQGASVGSITTAVRTRMNEIVARVNNYLNMKKPSFNKGTITLNGVGEDYAQTIADTNGVIGKWFKTSSPEGIGYEINGNTIKVWATSYFEGSKCIEYDLINPNDTRVKGESVVYINSSNKQKLASFADPVGQYASVDIRIANGSVEINKQDEDGKFIADTTFKLSYNADMSDEIGHFKTEENGSVLVENLKPGIFYIQEVSVPSPLILDSTIKSVEIAGNSTVIFTAVNSIQKGMITIVKEDSETGSIAQGDATLIGAEYDVYDEEKKNVVDHLTIGEKETTATLPLGTYYLKETKSPEGYLLNEDFIKVELEYAGQTQNISNITKIVEDEVIKGQVAITKTVDYLLPNGGIITAGIAKGMMQAGVGFVFDITLDSTNEVVDTLVTDEDGYAQSILLPYGTYTISEREKEGYHTISPIKVKIDENGKVYRYTLQNNIKQTKVVIVKKDADTKNVIPVSGVGFKLQKEDGTYLTQSVSGETVFYTNKEGVVILPETIKYGETYTVKEVSGSVPEKYLLSLEGVTFSAKGEESITLEMYNKAVKGEIQVLKTGEVLTEVYGEEGNYSFVYEKRPLKNVKFEVIAAEDIKAEDLTSNDYFKKGEVVSIITTGNDGIAKLGNLPLGKYIITEISAPEGMVLNKESQNIELKYAGESVAVVFEDIEVENKRQKVSINVIKKDSETQKGLEKAEFTLYAMEDILDVDGNVLVKANTAIEKVTTGIDGIAKFKADLPLFTYYIKETKSPYGYASSNKQVEIDASYKGQDVVTIFEEVEFTNEITKIEFSKLDITTGKELVDAKIKVIEKKSGAVMDAWVSTDKPHLIKGLQPGNTYMMIEESAPYGFALAEEIEFVVADTKEVQKVVMKDDIVYGKLGFNKTGLIFTSTLMGATEVGIIESPLFEESNILDAKITIYAAEDITLGNGVTYYSKDEVIQVLESDFETAWSKLLPVGKYYYVETKTPLGYVPNTDKHYFEIKDNESSEVQKITSTLSNDLPIYELKFIKIMEENEVEGLEEAYKDVVFGIFTRDDTYDYKGNVAIDEDVLVGCVGIDENGNLINIPKLPVGNYYLKELATHFAYELDENEYDFTIAQSADEKVVVTINDGNEVVNELKDFKIKINKVDSNTKEIITDKSFTFTRYKDENCTIVLDSIEANLKEGNVVFEEMHYGTYWIKETKAPEGYVLSEEIVKVEINEQGVFINDVLQENDKEYSFTYENEKIKEVKTKDTTHRNVYISMFLLAGIVLLAKRRKK